MTIPKPYEVYQHFKGKQYQIITIAEDSETGNSQVVYQALYAPYRIYVRPLTMFCEQLKKENYPEATQAYRFVKIEETKKEADVLEEGKPEAETFYDAEEVVEPLLLEFLDSDTYDEKMNILVALHPRLTDDMINSMAMALDVEVNEGKLEERYDALKSCLMTLQRYECNRLR